MEKLNPKERLKIQRRTSDLLKQVKGGELKPKDKLKLQREISANLKKLGRSGKKKAEPKTEASNSIVERFVAGEFKDNELNDFLTVIDDVEAAGGTLEQIKQGASGWINANTDKLAA